MKKTLTPVELRHELASAKPLLVIDVRRPDDRGPEGIPGADWRSPALLEDWAGGVPAGAEVVVYCVRGGQVSQGVQAALAARGVTARFLEGGLVAWAADEALERDPDLDLLRAQGVSGKGVAHALHVARVALWLAANLDPAKAGPLDLDLVRRGALLHDLGKVRDTGNLHGVVGAELARGLGLPEAVLGCIEKHVRHGLPQDQTEALGLPARDFSFTRIEERLVSYADKLADVLAAGLAEDPAEAHARLPEILAARPALAKDEATLGRYLASRELLLAWARG
jgi:uncharacterized protein